MTLATDRIKALNHQSPEFIPLRISLLPAAWLQYRDELKAIVNRYPELSEALMQDTSGGYEAMVRGSYAVGEHVDAWGCVWQNIKHGQEAIVTGHPVPTREAVHSLPLPTRDIGFPHGFMFLRLTDLRGFEEAMVDFAEEPEELALLIDKVLQYNLRQLALLQKQLADRPGEIAWFGDDLGTQHGLPISPVTWRRYLKPCYTRIYQPLRAAGHPVYMHTDGHILDIIPDLIDAGVSIVNPQVRANGIDHLVRVAKGRVCIDLDLDRQMFPFCTPHDIDAHVHEVVEKLGSPTGGLWLTAEMDDGVPLENIDAILAALVKYRRVNAAAQQAA